jgi:hypothetical protein
MAGETKGFRDAVSGFKFFQAIRPQVVDAGVTGVTVDTLGYGAATFAINIAEISSITSASYWVFRMQHASASDAGVDGTWSDVDASNVLTTSVSFTGTVTSGIVLSAFSDTGFESACHVVGYRGPRRYCRINIEEKGNLSTMTCGVVAILGWPEAWPVNTLG